MNGNGGVFSFIVALCIGAVLFSLALMVVLLLGTIVMVCLGLVLAFELIVLAIEIYDVIKRALQRKTEDSNPSA